MIALALGHPKRPLVSKSAVAQARQRTGVEPLAWLFENTAQAWTTQDAATHAFKGLSLWAMDGMTLRTADSPANRMRFGVQSYVSGKLASYLQVRAASLSALPMRGHERHFLIPAKSNRCREVVNGAPDDAIVRMRISPQACKKYVELTAYWEARAIRAIDARGR